MKNFPFFFIALALSISFNLTAQSNSQLISNVLGQDANISNSFTNGMIQMALNATCDPWDDDDPCTELCDPWDDKPCAGPGSIKASSQSTAEEKETLIVNTMIHFEKAIAKGRGGTILTPELLSQLTKKYKGNKLKTVKARFNAYLRVLKSKK